MSRSPNIRALEARLAAEFRAEWSSRQRVLDDAIQQASNRLGVQNLGRSSALLREHAQLLEQGLEDARGILISRAATLLSSAKAKRLPQMLERLRLVISGELNRLADEADQHLASQEDLIGIRANRNIQDKKKGLLTTLDSDLGAAVAAIRQPHAAAVRHWYERPAGLVGLTVAATLLAWLITDRACAA